jgi:hypothetical protein
MSGDIPNRGLHNDHEGRLSLARVGAMGKERIT